jgi:hypothetical protein
MKQIWVDTWVKCAVRNNDLIKQEDAVRMH